jgi:ABC-type transport system involved in multi-copper enzyme maturation permease subunit
MSQTKGRSPLIPYTRMQFAIHRKTALFWAIGLTIYCSLIVAIYPSVSDAIDISLIPANMREAFNINDFTQLASFLSSELFGVILPLLLPFFGIIALSNVVAGAEERGRLDVLLGNPIPRRHLIVGSYVMVASYLLLLVAVIGTVLWFMATVLDLELSARAAYRAAFALWPVTLAFGALALALSAIVRQRAVALGGTAAAVFLMFLANVVGKLAPPVSGVRYISAHHYYGNAIMDGIWWPGVAALLGAAGLLVTAAVLAFDRRDIYA